MIYYFIKDGENELGPFTIKQLECKTIREDTPVLFAGLEEWSVAGQVHELKELFATKVRPRFFPKFKINKIWNNKVLKQQFQKVAFHVL